MQTLSLIPGEERAIPFNFFFEDQIFAASFRSKSLIITFLELLLVFIQWQSSTFVASSITSNFSINFNIVCSISLDSVKSGIPVTSGYSHPEYWLLLQLCLLALCFYYSFLKHSIDMFTNNQFWPWHLKVFLQFTDLISYLSQSWIKLTLIIQG